MDSPGFEVDHEAAILKEVRYLRAKAVGGLGVLELGRLSFIQNMWGVTRWYKLGIGPTIIRLDDIDGVKAVSAVVFNGQTAFPLIWKYQRINSR